MRRILASLLAVVVCAAAAPISADPGLSSDEEQARLDAALLCFMLYHLRQETGELCPEGLGEGSRLSAEKLARRLGPPYQARTPARDPWGNSFDLECGDDGVTVLSPGPNRVYEHEYGRDDPYRHRRAPDTDDLLMIEGRLIQGPVSTVDRVQQTMADLRSIATAFESFAIDNNAYPSPPPGLVPVSLVEGDLEPIYIRVLPLTDAWGNEFLVSCRGADYVLLSRGADGILDFDVERQMAEGLTAGISGAVGDVGADAVFMNGQFIQWWEAAERP